ncbi:DUF4231 domain-containing protein [Solirubrobacter phytolaccae]|uniref:DUF4231 domain-containing protein n=1 Tax=Solirubrobacter phytolaccae TaxID=1404360 RepID=A0A9X3N8S1_9ACTN|nr:DUF4231 domain-containing protein [Solirubrobacter phytolaccae]MDA0181531.1 DUF4231 domain-containing protein [Solirubrobacter phytolaccae]
MNAPNGLKVSLLEECDRFIAEHTNKADRNKRRARLGTVAMAASTALIPASIVVSTAGHEFFWGKLVPSLLAAVAAIIAGLLTAERPHERWSLYRRYQRMFEAERLRYTSGVAPYRGADADATFASWLAAARLSVHEEWAGLIPASGEVASTTRPTA